MKICAIICEFNPFHRGHAYLIETAKRISGCDSVLCIMSGSFVQRGEPAILDKFTRAKHAVLSGADAVIELPAPFAVAPAEIFAKGAIDILSSIPDVTTLAFGCETPDKQELLRSARILAEENQAFKTALTTALESGESYAKSYTQAFESVGGNVEFLRSPNNILALEYTKAIIKNSAKIEVLPIQRIGEYHDEDCEKQFSSAQAIRKNLGSEQAREAVPAFVQDDLPDNSNVLERFKDLARFALLEHSTEEISKVYGCTEGLENKCKELCLLPYDEIVETITSKRYSSSRIRRILCANLLRFHQSDTEAFLKGGLFIKPLALNKNKAQAMLTSLSCSPLPIIIRARDLNGLPATVQQCHAACLYADAVYSQLAQKEIYNFTVTMV